MIEIIGLVLLNALIWGIFFYSLGKAIEIALDLLK